MMSIEVQALQQIEARLPRLGAPKWKDPERRQSIKDNSRVKMEWQLSSSLWTMTCWVALAPARPCLIDAMGQIEALVLKRQCDIWDGERTSPGCVWDRSMYGRSIQDAQPTIIFSSSSKICRRNAKRIIQEEDIQVDPRGIGIEYYENGPGFSAGPFDSLDLEAGCPTPPSKSKLPQEKAVTSAGNLLAYSNNHRESSPTRNAKPAINAALVHVGDVSCTMGGVLVVDGELYVLTVAHAFDCEIETNAETQGMKLSAILIPSVNGKS